MKETTDPAGTARRAVRMGTDASPRRPYRQGYDWSGPARVIFACAVLWLICASAHAATPSRPNILWISCEDTSDWLGFCGQTYATTPNLDKLASQGVHFTEAFSTAPVCSPSRFAIITGRYATSMGTQRLRSKFPIPDSIHSFPAELRKAGYYCSNNSKTDYNTSAERRLIREAWDESSPRAHWKSRKPGQPFFAVFNLTETHQGKIFEDAPPPKIPESLRHDPAKAPLPPYYPDTPEARRTIARVHDCITAMDQSAGKLLTEIDGAGLKNDTIVFFWPDHGQGIPRGKRTLWDTGLKVPLVVYCPQKYEGLLPTKPGTNCDRLVSLMDLGPTVLNILNLPVPPGLDGRPFLGKGVEPRSFIYGARDRIDEALDLSRSVRDGRYLYIRNYMPDISWSAPEGYSDQLGFRRQITQMAFEQKLSPAQLTYAGPTKPVEALYDTATDPWQLTNLASVVQQRLTLQRMRQELRRWQIETRDLGFIHEWEAARLCSQDKPLSEIAGSDAAYPLQRVLDTADMVGEAAQVPELSRRLSDTNAVVKYWALIGLRVAKAGDKEALRRCLRDESIPVRIEAANILASRFEDPEALEALASVLRTGDHDAQLHAARTLELLGPKAKLALPAMREAVQTDVQDLKFALAPAIHALSGDQVKASPGTKGKAKRNRRRNK